MHLSDLPFVMLVGGTISSMWHVEPTEEWASDCATGNLYADKLVEFMRASGDRGILEDVCLAMKGKTGIEVGFYCRLSEHLTLGRHVPPLRPADQDQ
jgi:hypothetical protein